MLPRATKNNYLFLEETGILIQICYYRSRNRKHMLRGHNIFSVLAKIMISENWISIYWYKTGIKYVKDSTIHQRLQYDVFVHSTCNYSNCSF